MKAEHKADRHPELNIPEGQILADFQDFQNWSSKTHEDIYLYICHDIYKIGKKIGQFI